jgi:hypothetical protein
MWPLNYYVFQTPYGSPTDEAEFSDGSQSVGLASSLVWGAGALSPEQSPASGPLQ